MIAHRSRDANTARRAFSLKPRRHIHRVTVKVSPIGNRVAKVDPDAKSDGSIGWLLAVVDRNLLLHLDGTAHRSVDAVEYDEQGIAAGLNNPATMLINRGIDHLSPERTQSLESSGVIYVDQATVANHVGIDDGDQLPLVLRPSCGVRCLGS